MKKTEVQNLKNKSEGELASELSASADKLWQVRNDVLSGKVKNVMAVRRIKKLIAVLKTILNEKKSASK